MAALVPLGVVTTTLAIPAAWAGVVAVMVVELTKAKVAAAVPPMVTPVAPVKSVPVMVMDVPPAVEPLVREILITVGVLVENTIVGRPPKVAVQPVVPAR